MIHFQTGKLSGNLLRFQLSSQRCNGALVTVYPRLHAGWRTKVSRNRQTPPLAGERWYRFCRPKICFYRANCVLTCCFRHFGGANKLCETLTVFLSHRQSYIKAVLLTRDPCNHIMENRNASNNA